MQPEDTEMRGLDTLARNLKAKGAWNGQNEG
jgi:hypothetical protein